jgi:hypothetical protein
MNKIPVSRTIAFAYSFTFGQIGTVIGLIWLPLLVFFVGDFFATTYYAQGIEAWSADADPAAIGKPFLALMGFYVAAMFVIAVIGVSITRQAMGLRKGGAIVNFGLGTAEINLFLSFLAAYLVVIAVCIGLFLGLLVFGGIAGVVLNTFTASMSKAAMATAALVLGVAVGLAMIAVVIYVSARLVFLLAAVTVAEEKIDLVRAWSLTKGNFWRIFAVGLATVLPITLIAAGANIAILGPQTFIPDFQTTAGTTVQMRQMAAEMRTMVDNLPLVLGLGLLLAPFTYGLLFSAPAFAYRALVAAPPLSPPDTGPLRPA